MIKRGLDEKFVWRIRGTPRHRVRRHKGYSSSWCADYLTRRGGAYPGWPGLTVAIELRKRRGPGAVRYVTVKGAPSAWGVAAVLGLGPNPHGLLN